MGELIAASVKAALRFWSRAIRGAWPWLILTTLVNSIPTPNREAAIGVVAVSSGVVIAATGKLYAIAFAKDRAQTSRSFGRVLASDLLLTLFLMVMATLALIIVLGFVFGTAWAVTNGRLHDLDTLGDVTDSRGHVLIYAATAIGLTGLTWIYARVSLNAAASVAEERVAMISTWPYTRGRVIGMLVVRGLILVALLVMEIIPVTILSILPLTPVLRAEIVNVVSGLFIAFMWLPLQIGAGAEFYRRRAPLPASAP